MPDLPRDAKLNAERLMALAAKLKLTPRMIAFADAWIRQLQRTDKTPSPMEAAIEVGYTKNPRTASSRGWKLLHHAGMQEYIAAIRVEVHEVARARNTDLVMGEAELLQRMTKQARVDAFDYLTLSPAERDKDGNVVKGGGFVIDLEKAKELGLGQGIKKLSYDHRGAPRLELTDAQVAQMNLARVLGMLKEDAPPPERTHFHEVWVHHIAEMPAAEQRVLHRKMLAAGAPMTPANGNGNGTDPA